MNSLRPLATISLLGIVGLFLYMKINETEPVVPADVAEWGDLDNLADIDIGATGDIANVDIGTMPVDTTVAATSAPQAVTQYAEVAESMTTAPPAFGPVPAFAPTATQTAAPYESPAPDSTAAAPVESAAGDRYAQTANSTAATPAAAAETTESKLPPLPELPAAAAAAGIGAAVNELAGSNATAAPATTAAPAATATESTVPAAAAATSSSAVPHVSTPGGSTAPEVEAANISTIDPMISAAPVTPTESLEAERQTTAGQASLFSATRVAVQSALDRGEFAQALLLLSDWYGDPSLSAAEATEVQQLLSQLAGSVIYSTEHRLEPPYLVQAGEKLSDIADKHNVPWQLLAKINGITNPDQLRPGQKLKVVRGPFSARIDLSERKLVLMLDRRYAGQFAIDIEPTTSIEAGHWSVNQKLLTPGTVGMLSPTAGTPGEERSILLTSTSASGQVTVIRGPGAASPAAADPAGRVVQLRGNDVEDVYDILSLGSQVVIRR